MRRGQSRLADPVVGDDLDGVDLPGSVEEGLGGRRVNIVTEAPPGLSSPAKVAMPTIVDLPGPGLGQHGGGVADLEVAVVGAAAVDDDLVVGARARRPRPGRRG